jgi:EmrB/QacA subfamily drug resistance transporter
MAERQVLEALSGLVLALFVAILSSTVVSAALPRIIADIGGGQSAFTWVIAITLLTMTLSTPIWGKMADLYDRKMLIQLGIVIFVAGSISAGFATSSAWLISCRGIQGIGIGGLVGLVQVILSDLVSPRERGRYMGYIGAVYGVGTVAGPLIGGGLTDSLGWRWCFLVPVPFAVLALVVLQLTLHLPARKRKDVHLDVAGATLIAVGVGLILIWVSLAGTSFDWLSWQTVGMVAGGAVVLIVAVVAERTAKQPLIPLNLFGERTVVLAVITSIAVGVAMYGTTLFLSQYMQLARGYNPTESGLLTIPMVIGLFTASTLSGRYITTSGHYRRIMILGAGSLTVGLLLMGQIDEHSRLVMVGVFMVFVGAGIGVLSQNVILAVQNVVSVNQMGAGSSLVSFFRSLGAAIGVSAMGAILGAKVARSVAHDLSAQHLQSNGVGQSDSIPRLSTLHEPVRGIVEHAYGTGVAEIFLLAAPMGLVALAAVWLLREQPLGTKSGIQLAAEQASLTEIRSALKPS